MVPLHTNLSLWIPWLYTGGCRPHVRVTHWIQIHYKSLLSIILKYFILQYFPLKSYTSVPKSKPIIKKRKTKITVISPTILLGIQVSSVLANRAESIFRLWLGSKSSMEMQAHIVSTLREVTFFVPTVWSLFKWWKTTWQIPPGQLLGWASW